LRGTPSQTIDLLAVSLHIERMSLKVFDLECQHGHVFEGWFSSHDDYDSQQARGFLSCPVCGDVTVTKRLSAPHLNVSHLHTPAREGRGMVPAKQSGTPGSAGSQQVDVAKFQAAVLQQVRQMVKSAENVGPRFAEEARRMHEGDAAARPIRGTATVEERQELAEEGIAVMGVPDFFDEDQLQ
jgi:hypothetical protein